MDVCGLGSAVELLVAWDDVTRGKPHPEPVLQALRVLELDDRADEVLFVGDSPFDIQAGRAAGTRTAAVSWGPFEMEALEAEGPDYVLGRLHDVLGLSPEGAAES